MGYTNVFDKQEQNKFICFAERRKRLILMNVFDKRIQRKDLINPLIKSDKKEEKEESIIL